MGSTRLAGIPIDHVRAEVAAFPVASEAAFRLGRTLTGLDPTMGEPTRELWRRAEETLLGVFPSFSVDEAVAIRDRIWFKNSTSSVNPLHVYLRRVARIVLDVHGARATPACMGNPLLARTGCPSTDAHE